MRKVSSQIFVRLFGPSFNKIGPKIWKLEATTDRHTHTHTDAQTGIVLGQIFSPEMTEYKKSIEVIFLLKLGEKIYKNVYKFFNLR